MHSGCLLVLLFVARQFDPPTFVLCYNILMLNDTKISPFLTENTVTYPRTNTERLEDDINIVTHADSFLTEIKGACKNINSQIGKDFDEKLESCVNELDQKLKDFIDEKRFFYF